MLRRYARTWEETVCRRRDDGTLWISSSDGRVKAIAALFGVGNTFFFRRIHKLGGEYLSDFANTWEFSDFSMFDIIEKKRILVKRNAWKAYRGNL